MLIHKNKLDGPFQLTRLAKARAETLAASTLLFNIACLVEEASRYPIERMRRDLSMFISTLPLVHVFYKPPIF